MDDNYMTTEQILECARTEINKEGFKFFETAEDDEENFYTVESLYIQWAKDEKKSTDALWAMFEEECPEHF